ncbi:response regulator [Pseudomonadota bacterium]|nr:response regulator [Pseudomonadota bacterium]
MQKTAVIVDDSRVARMTLKKLLLVDDFEVVEFGSGEEALNYLASVKINPDIIFMDVMMNGMDGLTATRKLKENSKLSNIPIVMCTGNDTEEDKQKALEVGAITALTKPPEAHALAEIITNVNVASQQTQQEPAAVFDQAAFIIKARIEIEKQLTEQLEIKSRQIAEETTSRIIAEQVNAKIDHVQRQVAEQTELVRTANASSDVEGAVAEACRDAAEENVLRIAATSIQQLLEEANLPKQISDFLAQEGEEWLTDQEEELGVQLNAQLELHIPRMVNEHLKTNLKSFITPIVSDHADSQRVDSSESLTKSQVEQIVNSSLHSYTPTVVQPMISCEIRKRFLEQEKADGERDDALIQVNQQLAKLKMITISLGLVVVGLIAVVLNEII